MNEPTPSQQSRSKTRAEDKGINYLSIDSVNLHNLAGAQSHIINNTDVSIILNGRPSNRTFFQEGEIYQLPEPRLLLFTGGEADVHLDLEQYHFERGTVVLTSPDTILEFESIGKEAEVCGIAMKESIHIAETFVTKISEKDATLLLRMMYLLWDIATQTPYRRQTVLQLVRAMVTDVQYVKQSSDTTEPRTAISRHQELFREFKTLINRHCEHQRSIPFYAEKLRITPHHLSSVVSRASGHSALYWINHAVVLRAKVLLRTSSLLTYQIAERLHFATPPAFNNFFKRETGLTPKEYRRKARAQ